jgi:hypothetical protein
MDDLIALFDAPDNEGDLQEDESPEAPPNHPRSKRSKKQKRPSSSPSSKKNKAQIAVDERVGGIHMINRKISSSQLAEYMDENEFHTAAQLAYYSHSVLNTTVLLDSVDMSTTPLAGKTRIFTVGIVLNHTGSRLTSANGQAFAKVELGTLRTGPTVAVLLFGDAYRVHAKSAITPGTVIGLRQPRLLPPKPSVAHHHQQQQQQSGPGGGGGDAARITFAINDADQLLHIAQARDFGYCHGSCRGKDERGVWVTDARPCRNIVDVSICRFCKDHQKQAMFAKNGKSTSNLHVLREQTMMMARNQQIAMASHRKDNNKSGGGRIMTFPTKAIGRNGGPPGQTNSLLNPTVTPPPRPSSTGPLIQMMKAPPGATITKRQTTTNRYNGSVLVPPPSSIFGRCHPQAMQSRLVGLSNRGGPRERNPDEILEQQKRIAKQAQAAVKATTITTTTKKLQLSSKMKPVSSKVVTTTTISNSQNAFAAAFGPTLDKATEEAVRNAKSSFANQSNAEEYAVTCQALDELEKLETKKRAHEPPSKRLLQIWHCRTCQCEFKTKPTPCYRRHHKIKVELILSDKRQKQTGTDQTDDGLVLGQGLHWSRE